MKKVKISNMLEDVVLTLSWINYLGNVNVTITSLNKQIVFYLYENSITQDQVSHICDFLEDVQDTQYCFREHDIETIKENILSMESRFIDEYEFICQY